MIFTFSRHGLQGRQQTLQRILELVPGATSWTLLLGMVCLSIWQPLLGAILVIAFYLYWIFRLFYLTLFLILSYCCLTIERRTDWLAWVQGLDQPAQFLLERERAPHRREWWEEIATWWHRRALQRFVRRGVRAPSLSQIYHLVIVPIAKEPRGVYEPGIARLRDQEFPPERIFVVLAVEARAPADIRRQALDVQARYRQAFFDFFVVVHPDGVPGEARVKGANATHAAKAAATALQNQGIAFEHVVVSCFDADTVVSPEYFVCLTYHFLMCPKRTRASFQPVPVYHNNVWDVPGFARVLDVGASFFQLVEATNPDKLVTFSSHSMSFQALVETGYWPVDMISDDSAIFWKAFLHYDGDYRVVPMYVTVSMDVAASSSWRKTALNVYRQKRRWAWGVENFPIVMRAFLQARALSWSTKLSHAFKMFESHVSWATWPFLVSIIGWLPALFAGREFSSSVMYYSAPRIAAIIFRLASAGLATTIVLSMCLLPPPPTRRPLFRTVAHLFEWLLIPVIAMLFSALPALDAQTRLMRGRYLEFWVTDKHRSS